MSRPNPNDDNKSDVAGFNIDEISRFGYSEMGRSASPSKQSPSKTAESIAPALKTSKTKFDLKTIGTQSIISENSSPPKTTI